MNLNFELIKFQRFFRSKFYCKKLIHNEINTIINQLDSITKRIESSKVDKIISINNYLYYIDYLSIIESFVSSIFSKQSTYEMIKQLVIIKKKIKFIIQSAGMNTIYDIIDLFVKNNHNIKNDTCLQFYNI